MHCSLSASSLDQISSLFRIVFLWCSTNLNSFPFVWRKGFGLARVYCTDKGCIENNTFSDIVSSADDLLVYNTLSVPPTGASFVIIQWQNYPIMERDTSKPDGNVAVMLVGVLVPAGLTAVTLHTY